MRKGTIGAVGVAAVIAGSLVVASFLSEHGFSSIARLRSNVGTLEAEKSRLAHHVDQLEREIEALKSGGSYRQKVIRDEIGYVRSNEVIVDLGGATTP